jgi:Na+-driven multidrug efflux pump
MWVASIVLMGLGIGAQAIIARAMGSGDLDEARVAGGTAVYRLWPQLDRWLSARSL